MISLLVINYRSATLAAEAVRSARASSSQKLEVVVVDNTCDATEAESVNAIGDKTLIADRNLGYAAAINAGRRLCTGEIIIVANPDVVFGDNSIDELIGSEAAVAGPALYWDSRYEWMLPPADLYTARQKLDESLATRSRIWSRWRDRRRFRHRLKFWTLTTAIPVEALSGAVMAIRTDVFDRVGGFDERFFLYFEENDFLRRVAAVRESIMYVPRARCRHVYNQSAGADSDRSAQLFARSERQYLEKWNGSLLARVLKDLERPAMALPPAEIAGPIALPAGDLVVEASPLASFATSAGHFPSGSSADVPPEVLTTYRGGRLYLRVVDRRTARVLQTYVRLGVD